MKNRAIHLGILSTALLLLLAACSVPATRPPEIQEIIVVRDNPTLPEGCRPTEVAPLIIEFLDAYNRGDQEQLTSFFPRTFEWYTDAVEADGVEIDEEHYFLTRPGSRDVLLNYFAERRPHHDRLQLIEVDVAGPGWHGGADISFTLTREADDIRPGPDGRERYVVGRGTIRCQSQKFWTWSMGTVPPHIAESDLSHVCPEPPDGAPENAVVACARPVPEEEG